MTGMTIHPDNPLAFDFIVDTGDDNLEGEALRNESKKLINYFMATLTVPEDQMWVNLSPYEKNRIIADGLGQTEMGRDMLAQDYLLKQLTASLMYPENGLGMEFWNRVKSAVLSRQLSESRNNQSEDWKLMTEDLMQTFNKVWVVPDEASVYVNDNSVFVVKSHLKVMLEEDYLALQHANAGNGHARSLQSCNNAGTEHCSVPTDNHSLSQIIREILIPEIEKEVNEGKNFAQLRQIFNSMILATWYKKNLKESILNKVYVDQNKMAGVDLVGKEVPGQIYNQYIEAFKKGVYNFIKEDYDPNTQEVVPRKYFSGGFKENLAMLGEASSGEAERRLIADRGTVRDVEVRLGSAAMMGLSQADTTLSDNAMTAERKEFIERIISQKWRIVG